MKSLITLAIAFLIPNSSFLINAVCAQSISGVINTYAHVIAIDTCLNAAIVPDTNGFAVGDRVLIIQMKGAAIDTTNSASYGMIESLNGAGLFEIATIQSLPNATTIRFADKLLNWYDTKTGPVQLVRIPQYTNVTIADTLRAKYWDNQTGGILILEVSGTLTMNAPIDVSGCGYAGGITSFGSGGGDSITDYAFIGNFGSMINDGGYKADGIAFAANFLWAGRGAPANAGGGGNAFNSGGGGGGNGGMGGRGGDQSNAPEKGRFANGGEPGKAIALSLPTRLFMGGGGGGGQQNDLFGTDGGHGGGIAIIRAKKIEGTALTILANGWTSNGTLSHTDGAGGSGAGGTVVLDVPSITNGFYVEAVGGDGGGAEGRPFPTAPPGPWGYGPGGGGGGGAVYINPLVAGAVAAGVSGGKSGVLTQCSDPTINNTPYGAVGGHAGLIEDTTIFPESVIPYIYPAADNHSLSVCAGDSVAISASGGDAYQWSPSNGVSNPTGDSIMVSPSSTTVYTVQITKAACAFTDTVHVEVLANPDATIAGDTVTCDSNSVTYAAPGTAGVTYQWTVDGGAPAFGTGYSISVQWSAAGTGLLGLKASNGMCSAGTTRQIKIATPIAPVIDATQLVLANAGDTSVLSLADSYVSYLWSTGETASTITVESAGIYSVTVIDANGCTGTSSVEIDYPSAVPSVELALGDISANPGDHVFLPVNIITSQNLGSARATDFTYMIHFDQSLLEPVDAATTSTFRNGERYVTKHGTISNQLSTSSLDQIEFLAALGDATGTPIFFDTVIWTSGKPIATTLDSGHFTLLGVCPAGGDRLFYASGNVAINEIRPNPTSGIGVADYSLSEPGATTLVVLDMLGRTMLTIASGDAKAGEYHAAFDASTLPNGLYTLLLRTPSQVFTKRLEVYH